METSTEIVGLVKKFSTIFSKIFLNFVKDEKFIESVKVVYRKIVIDTVKIVKEEMKNNKNANI